MIWDSPTVVAGEEEQGNSEQGKGGSSQCAARDFAGAVNDGPYLE